MLLRIGDKVVNRQKIIHKIDEMLELRRNGLSQQETANQVGVDRTFISRLEALGEIRKGHRVALIGFPIKNCQEVQELAKKEGIEYCLVLTEKERWDFVQQKTGVELFNDIMTSIAELRRHDIIIVLGSNMRIKLLETLIDKEVIGIQIGESPIAEDKIVNIDIISSVIEQTKQ